MKRGFKNIEHKKYTAPKGKRRKFVQRAPIRRLISLARRYVQFLSEAFVTYGAVDNFISQLIAHGGERPSDMARRKFFAHRPKPANNQEKNRARRHSHVLKLGAATPGNKPEPAIRINAAQVRANQLLIGMDPRAIRSITRDGRHRNRGDSVAQHRRKERKAARRAKHKRAA